MPPFRCGRATALTECVTASCLTPIHKQKEGSIGIPFPDTYYKIVKPGTQEEVPYGEEGEICLTGPTMMMGISTTPRKRRRPSRPMRTALPGSTPATWA